MQGITLSTAFALCGLLTGGAASAQSAVPDGYTLVWHDEFNQSGAPDPANWTFEHGFVRNGELQWFQADNARVSDGRLVIEARRETKANPLFRDPRVAEPFRGRRNIRFTSASVTTKAIRLFKDGRIDIRARFPAEDGVWPALWFVGQKGSWPSNGEIDLFEYYHGQIHANFAWAGSALHRPTWRSVKIPLLQWSNDPHWGEQFHVWTMDWDPRRITLLLDGRTINQLDLDTVKNVTGAAVANPFRQPAYLIMGMALGGQNGGAVSHVRFPAHFEIDYVRAYRRSDAR